MALVHNIHNNSIFQDFFEYDIQLMTAPKLVTRTL